MPARGAAPLPGQPDKPVAVILCGGQGLRMDGADKGLLDWQGRPLYQQVLAQFDHGAVEQIYLSANRHQSRYAQSGLAVLSDLRSGFHGPLAGIEAALCASRPDWLLVLPCDVPQLPADLLARLWAARHLAPIVRARCAERSHPVIALLRGSLLPALSAALDAGERAVGRWQAAQGVVEVAFTHSFPNINQAGLLQPRPA